MINLTESRFLQAYTDFDLWILWTFYNGAQLKFDTKKIKIDRKWLKFRFKGPLPDF